MPPADFVPLAVLLGAARVATAAPPAADECETLVAEEGEPPDAAVTSEVAAAIGAARRFRAALSDALDVERATLLRELASAVLARELALAPCDLAALVERMRADAQTSDAVRVRIAPADAAAHVSLPTIVDPSLAAGDAILECRTGTIDGRLGVRLADVLG